MAASSLQCGASKRSWHGVAHTFGVYAWPWGGEAPAGRSTRLQGEDHSVSLRTAVAARTTAFVRYAPTRALLGRVPVFLRMLSRCAVAFTYASRRGGHAASCPSLWRSKPLHAPRIIQRAALVAGSRMACFAQRRRSTRLGGRALPREWSRGQDWDGRGSYARVLKGMCPPRFVALTRADAKEAVVVFRRSSTSGLQREPSACAQAFAKRCTVRFAPPAMPQRPAQPLACAAFWQAPWPCA